MRCVLLIFLIGWMMPSWAPDIKTKGWRGIVPLHSSRTDVDSLLGKPEDPTKKHSLVYSTDKEIVLVDYTSGPPCGPESGWRVPAGTVTSIMVSPKYESTLSKLDIDEAKYRKVHKPDMPPGRSFYIDDAGGETIDVLEGRVLTVTYSASALDEHLRCVNSKASAQIENHPMDTYHYLPFKHEKQRLDNFAVHLQQEAETRGYIVVYSGPQISLPNSLRRARRAKSYIVSVRGVTANRIAVIKGGRRDEFTIELYIIHKAAPAPRPELGISRR